MKKFISLLTNMILLLWIWKILDIKIQKNQTYPFNLKISGKKNKEQDFRIDVGPGIYFITEKKTNYLLYIGCIHLKKILCMRQNFTI